MLTSSSVWLLIWKYHRLAPDWRSGRAVPAWSRRTPGIRLPPQDTDQREYGRTLLLQIPSGRTPQDWPRERWTLLHRGTSPADLRAFLRQHLPYRQGEAHRKDKGRREKPAFALRCGACHGWKEQITASNRHYRKIISKWLPWRVFTVVSRCSFATVNMEHLRKCIQPVKNIINMSKWR